MRFLYSLTGRSRSVLSILVTSAALGSAPLLHAGTWLLDFGGGGTDETTVDLRTWNNINPTIGRSDTGMLFDLRDTDGFFTDVDFMMVSRFNNANLNGTLAFGDYPATATKDSLFGNTELWETLTNVFPRFKLTSLDPELTYDFTFYASRMGVAVGENRETLYTVIGATVDSVALNIANNVSNTVTLSGMAPNEFGEIEIALSPGPNNNNSFHFTYLGVLEVTAIPEPATGVLLMGAAGMLAVRRRRSR